MADSVPTDTRRLRACLLCSLVKFRRDGCDNCEAVLKMRGSMERVTDCTSGQFQGTIAMMQPGDSWVSRWQRMPDTYSPGIYAMSVSGSLPDDIVDVLERRGV